MGSQCGGFGGSLVEGVGAEAGPFVLVVGLESAAGEGQQLALEVGGDEVHVADAWHVDGDLEEPSARRRGGAAGVVGLDRVQPGRERRSRCCGP